MAEVTFNRRLRLATRIPLLVIVLAFTAIPAELRLPNTETIGAAVRMEASRQDVPDMLANVAGYVPVGVVLAGLGVGRALGIATGLSLFAEGTQLFSVGRSPSFSDLVMNIIGTLIGVALTARCQFRMPSIEITGRNALLAAALALGFIGFGTRLTPRLIDKSLVTFVNAHTVSWLPASASGVTSGGMLEAHWDFNEINENVMRDSSGNGLDGVLVGRPTLVAGINDRALRLNGVNQYVRLGNPTELRLTGSMTLIAEINPSSFPVDDAAIVSTLSKIELGYQLDATVDRGPRTIGFKLADNSGRLMARYGRTPLRTDNWYHVAGVYDAELQTLDVYLDGRKDNGCLLGTVTARQHISGAEVYVGRRADLTGFEFPGSIDDVKIYSMALTPGQIETDMEMRRAARSEALPLGSRVREEPIPNSDGSGGTCASSQMPDASSAGFVVVCGFLVALASAGLWPNAPSRMACLTVSIAAGFLLIPSADPALQPFYPWMVPLLTLMGGATVAASLRPCTVLAHENH